MIKLIKSTFYKEKETKKQLKKFISAARQLSFGPQCQKFEKNFAKWQNRKYCVFVNSGSSANLTIIQSLLNLEKIKKEDMVQQSFFTKYVSSAKSPNAKLVHKQGLYFPNNPDLTDKEIKILIKIFSQ